MNLILALVISLAINFILFFPAYFFKTDKVTDFSYSISFIIIAALSFLSSNLDIYAGLLCSIIIVWAARLGAFLLMRIRAKGKDSRFNSIRENFWKFMGFWLWQGFSVWMVLLPSLLFFKAKIHVFCIFNIVGIGIWAIGLIIESIADMQKYRFYLVPGNRKRWIATGLWKYSRHPNYFGEILVWLGIYVFTMCSLSPWQVAFGIIGPLYIALLLIFVSGVPILERAADARFSLNPDYALYKKSTNKLFPYFPRRLHKSS